MVFSSPVFLFAFLPAVLLLCFGAPKRWRNDVLLAASLLFYAWGEQEMVAITLASIAGNYLFGLLVAQSAGGPAARRWVGRATVFNLLLLVAFKYANFAADNLNVGISALGLPELRLPRILLPIGISFFTFHALSYVIDVYRGAAPAQRNPLRFALYIAFFPQLIAGPIVRYHEIAPQLAERTLTLAGFAQGVRRFIVGLGKKVLIANTAAEVADVVFSHSAADVTPGLAWVGIACYAIQIYYDFSGYSDMAIGLAAMFGFRFPENFQHPYASLSITEFWRRWHISLSTWFRDYLYIPLGGSRGSAARTYRNLLIVFLLCGLWHGASWSFVVWGLFHGALLVGERAGGMSVLARLPTPLRRAYALGAVLVGWVFFRSDTLPQALDYLGAMVGLGNGQAINAVPHYWSRSLALVLALGTLGSFPVVPWLGERLERLRAHGGPTGFLGEVADVLAHAALLAVLVACAAWLAAGTHNPFIYFRF
jgi:alginate O-acetyltransferase complex protein AlgI